MTDEETKEAVKEQEVAEPVAQETDQNVQEEASKEDQVQKEKEYNFRRLRETKEALQRENEDLKAQISNKDETEEEDDIITKKQALEMVEKVVAPLRVKAAFSDFDEIVNKQTLDDFEKNEPELSSLCMSAPVPLEAAYRMLKRLGKEKKEVKDTKNADKIDENLKAPLSSAAFAKKSSIREATNFGEMSKEDLFKEMMGYARKA